MSTPAACFRLMSPLLLLCGLAWPLPARADHWDPGSATEIAAELERVLASVEVAAPPAQLTAGERQGREKTRAQLRDLRGDSAALAKRLGEGAGASDTRALVQRIRSLRDQVARDGPAGGMDAASLQKLVQAEKLLSALEAYYEDPH
jgi:hypothetical protein